jgi:hypothetical protein
MTPVEEAKQVFEREIGATGVHHVIEPVGNESFLKFIVGRDAPLYNHALLETQAHLDIQNPFKGKLGIQIERADKFPDSLEAGCLLTLLTRSTRAIAEGIESKGFVVPYVPFQNREDHQLAQPASHIVIGRRGVGKSTLIRRAVELLSDSPAIIVVLDMQGYSNLRKADLFKEVMQDIVAGITRGADQVSRRFSIGLDSTSLGKIGARLDTGELNPEGSVPLIKRQLKGLTTRTGNHVYVFLDDYHLIDAKIQPELLDLLHGPLKGASGWLKVSALRTLFNNYSAKTRKGLQIPGDAQSISLDLTLENPEAAERHLRAILGNFLRAVGYSLSERVIPDAAFKRLVWANAGVPRDFLQMFARALEHARRNRHTSVTVSDVNIAIGEFGQTKMEELREDARNEAGQLQDIVKALEDYCLDVNKVNGFLLKSEESNERRLIRILSDLRLVHLIHQSITPERAGERYEAFILDYSLFTGFRRRPNIREMVPSESGQFKASDLRKLPKIAKGFLQRTLQLQ